MKKPSQKKKAVSKKRPVKKKSTRAAVSPSSQPATSLNVNRILVPIDFSGYAKKALRYAIPMAKQYAATIYLIYVIEPTIYPADLGFGQVVMPGVENELRTKGMEELKDMIEEEIGGKVPAEAIVRTGKPHQEILKEVEERNIDLIVIATHGHTGVEQILFGSTAMRIVRLSKCPVLTIRP